MSEEVTEPYSRSSTPARCLDGQHGAVQGVGDVVCLLFALGLVPAPRLLLALHLGHPRVGCPLGQLARAQEVAQVAGRDVHHVALAAELVDVLKQDRLGSFATHGFLVTVGWSGPRPMVA